MVSLPPIFRTWRGCTPVSNTITEMYTMQRYLQMSALASYGIAEFDAWAGTFGDIVTQLELAPSGKGFRTVRSFSKFVNIPELIALYSCVTDTQTAFRAAAAACAVQEKRQVSAQMADLSQTGC